MKTSTKLILLFVATVFSLQMYAQSSIHFDGFNDYVYVENVTSLQVTDAMTIEAWINADTWQSVLYKGSVVSNGNGTDGNNGFDLRAGDDGKVEFNIAIDGAWKSIKTEPLMELGEWNHIAAVYDGSYIRLYVNGVERVFSPVSGTISDFQKKLYFGECPGYSTRLFDGMIDEIRFWNVARSAEEIRNNINVELIGTEIGLTGYWMFDEGEGATAFDKTENHHDGTLFRIDIINGWDENYVCNIVNPDIGITNLLSPISGMGLSDSEEITVRISNFSLNEATNIKIGYTINGGNMVSETTTASVEPLGNLDYTFTQKANLSVAGNYSINTLVTMPGDSDLSNNNYSKVVSNFDENSNFALNFDGIDDKVVIPHSDELCPTSALTVEAWINANDWKLQTWAGTIVGKDGDEDDGASGYVLRAGNNGVVEFVVTAPGWNGCASAPILETGRWYHVAGVYDGSTIKIYVNGNLQNTKSADSTLNFSSFDLNIGESGGFSGRIFDGKIDEVRIWNIARNETELYSYMDSSLEGNETGLVAYYQLNDGLDHTTVIDKTSNGNDGTLTDMDVSSAWVAGYELIIKDVGVAGIVSPVNGPIFTSEEHVKVEIKNYAFKAISNFNIYYSIDEASVITETVTDTIEPFGSIIYEFENTVDLSGVDSFFITAYTSLTGDFYTDNDSYTAKIIESNPIVLFNQVQHNFGAEGQVHTTQVYLPESLDNYSQILMHVSLECPRYGCDPWDQFANITLKKDGQSYEIARYITPYGVPWEEGWTYDITDFRELLTGKVEFTSFIMVWGANGWLVNVSIELVEGTPEYEFVEVQTLWDINYLTYGDPDVSYDIEEKNVFIPTNVESVKVRFTQTGHGQANTFNAAEFYETTHHLIINNSDSIENHLWKSDCHLNDCSPQSGTWEYARAGWCPGQDVQPKIFDLDGVYEAGTFINMDYVLQEYTNLLNTGYNSGSHTEPHYKIKGYLVFYGNEEFTSINDKRIISKENKINIFPNPSTGVFNISFVSDTKLNSIQVYDLQGKNVKNINFGNTNMSNNVQFNLQNICVGVYFVKIQTSDFVTVKKLILNK